MFYEIKNGITSTVDYNQLESPPASIFDLYESAADVGEFMAKSIVPEPNRSLTLSKRAGGKQIIAVIVRKIAGDCYPILFSEGPFKVRYNITPDLTTFTINWNNMSDKPMHRTFDLAKYTHHLVWSKNR